MATDNTKIYQIPECNLPALKEKINRLIKRAAKLNCQPIVFTVGEPRDIPLVSVPGINGPETQAWFDETKTPDPAKIIGYRRYYPVSVIGDAPKLNGWILAATLQRVDLDDRVTGILRTAGNQAIPAPMRERVGECDHCKTDRLRNDVYIVRHAETDVFKVVGSTCLADFLGHQSPEHYVSFAEMLIELDELCAGAEDEGFFGCGGTASRWGTDQVLAIAATIISIDGYFSMKKAKETYEEHRATSNTVATYLFAKPSTQTYEETRKRYILTDAARELAEAARQWACTLEGNSNEYLHTLSVIARAASVDHRLLGYATSMIPSYQREMGIQEENKREYGKSVHVGHIGERTSLTLILTGVTLHEGAYGLKTIMNYRTPAGCKITWFASGSVPDEMREVGREYKVIATIQDHTEYQNVKQTKVSRLKLDDGKPIRPTKKKAKLSPFSDINGNTLAVGNNVEWISETGAIVQGTVEKLITQKYLSPEVMLKTSAGSTHFMSPSKLRQVTIGETTQVEAA